MNLKVSVIIPALNRLNLLKEAIQSVLEQSYKNYEFMVVDDGSCDGTSEFIQKNYPIIKIISQQNQGVSKARNEGIKNTQSEWVCFLDADDLWTPNKLKEQLEQTVEKKYLISYTNEIWYRNGKRVNPKKSHQKYSGDIFDKSLPLCIISASSVLIHRSVFDAVGLFDESLLVCEDYDLWLRISSQFQVLYLPEIFIIKRNGVDDLHLSKKYWGMDRFRIQSLKKNLKELKLTNLQHSQLISELNRKKSIFKAGAKKRGKNRQPIYGNEMS